MLVKGACPLSMVLQIKANVWIKNPMVTTDKPVFAELSFFENKNAR
jgi:hypothetical protein